MKSLLSRVEKIQRECVDVQDKSKHLQQDCKFTLLRRKIGIEIKSAKDLIKERDNAEDVIPGSYKIAELSYHVRAKIREVILDTDKLEKMYQRSHDRFTKKNKADPEKEKKLELHKEEVGLARAHIQELELKSQKRTGNAFIPLATSNAGTVPTMLPDIDNEDFRQLHIHNKIIDGNLDKIYDLLQTTKEIAIDMGTNANKQSVMIDNLTQKTDKLEIKLETINVRLKKLIKGIRKADRFLIDVALICVLLGIGGFIMI
ncbi:hypothetical protein DLAC_08962 [Tieghemostelium lacteum]|uniref:t-SNARE coiled-coil homology domain-containing protein n=1 Tax=Tieghemostelium lacteum TaxID=361077 RepID=A0A151Z8T2_TIELA|nr:hypothetical protein DLAC_08962 [Tieghemostelium lacteum]|eukprot:KYQ90348.1 hypothetical protein DLAC_08962 [Tieghemostelium lacteum]